MDELFSCRNCIHNSSQTLSVGQSVGMCLKYNSIICNPVRTTCKNQYRKDLPNFIVQESKKEHELEFFEFNGIVDLLTKENVNSISYSERFAWEKNQFDSTINALSRYHSGGKKWTFIQAFSGGIDGRRSITHSSLIRRYMSVCKTWKSSFRLTLDSVSQLSVKPEFLPLDIYANGGGADEALWDVVFSRLSLVQEYGWYADLPDLQWITDTITSLSDLDWESVRDELDKAIPIIHEKMLVHAKDNEAYFQSNSIRLPTSDEVKSV